MPTPARALSLLALACLLSVAHPGLAQIAPPPDSGGAMPDGADLGHAGDTGELSKRTPKENLELAWIWLEKGVADKKHPEVQMQALAALSQIAPNPRALALIRGALSDPNPHVRVVAATAAGQSRSAAIVPDLQKLLKDPVGDVVFSADLALTKLGSPPSGATALTPEQMAIDPFVHSNLTREYVQKHGGDGSRAQAIDALAKAGLPLLPPA